MDSVHGMAAARAAADSVDPRTLGLVKVAYSTNEVIDILSIGRTSLDVEVNSGRLVAVKRGKSRLFLASDLAAYLLALRAETLRKRGLAAETHGVSP
jgi:hypothetical protein